MQGVYSQLHAIEMGYDSLDAADLLPDTRQTQLYVRLAIAALYGIREMTQNKRFRMIQIHEKRYVHIGQIKYYYEDTYTPLSKTTDESKLVHVKPTSSQPKYTNHREAWWDTQPAKSEEMSYSSAAWGRRIRQGQTCHLEPL